MDSLKRKRARNINLNGSSENRVPSTEQPKFIDILLISGTEIPLLSGTDKKNASDSTKFERQVLIPFTKLALPSGNTGKQQNQQPQEPNISPAYQKLATGGRYGGTIEYIAAAQVVTLDGNPTELANNDTFYDPFSEQVCTCKNTFLRFTLTSSAKPGVVRCWRLSVVEITALVLGGFLPALSNFSFHARQAGRGFQELIPWSPIAAHINRESWAHAHVLLAALKSKNWSGVRQNGHEKNGEKETNRVGFYVVTSAERNSTAGISTRSDARSSSTTYLGYRDSQRCFRSASLLQGRLANPGGDSKMKGKSQNEHTSKKIIHVVDNADGMIGSLQDLGQNETSVVGITSTVLNHDISAGESLVVFLLLDDLATAEDW